MTKKQTAKFLNFRYKILALILVVLAGGLVLLPKYQKNEGIKPEQLLANTISLERYISTDQMAHKLISQDPSFILVDVRDENSYNSYTLPNAINIPLKKLLDDESKAYLNQNQFDVVFFSNDHYYADQAWILCNRLGFKNLRVLKGGLNHWFKTIINPPKPTEDMPEEAYSLYDTRKAASMFFGVVYPDQVQSNEVETPKIAPKKIITVKKKKKVAEGGC
ncbi:rhodanese-like domain-containing protein [Mariniflexile fucanivorans]|uniref:Rhodanese-like domain-containing protein n=1 Tax=Mariniflexile fucanivorans TaxID=264023 RepID=A0A4R1RN39_9FLAO|nr:rhodanese-like domain-containing protein [Mariniflexile fucanivorans]TCL67708.1 rhodanese-like domain-containing protein [Mariniflexile fucanivorans]